MSLQSGSRRLPDSTRGGSSLAGGRRAEALRGVRLQPRLHPVVIDLSVDPRWSLEVWAPPRDRNRSPRRSAGGFGCPSPPGTRFPGGPTRV